MLFDERVTCNYSLYMLNWISRIINYLGGDWYLVHETPCMVNIIAADNLATKEFAIMCTFYFSLTTPFY